MLYLLDWTTILLLGRTHIHTHTQTSSPALRVKSWQQQLAVASSTSSRGPEALVDYDQKLVYSYGSSSIQLVTSISAWRRPHRPIYQAAGAARYLAYFMYVLPRKVSSYLSSYLSAAGDLFRFQRSSCSRIV